MTRTLKPGSLLSYFSYNIRIMSMYRAPTGYFIYFINKLEIIFHSLYNTNIQFTNGSDLNINHFVENDFKKVLVSLLTSYVFSS